MRTYGKAEELSQWPPHTSSRENLITLESECIATFTKQGIESFMKVSFKDEKVQQYFIHNPKSSWKWKVS